MGKIYLGKPLQTKTREELLATLRPADRQDLRADNGDLPAAFEPPPPPPPVATAESHALSM